MLSFKEYRNLLLISEGGNVVIGDVAAQRIDLSKYQREKVVATIEKGLNSINRSFEKFAGFPLWSRELLDSLDYLSGSAKHFFDVKSISSGEFVKHKPSVGDIDTMIDGAAAPILKDFLNSTKAGTVFDTLEYVGFKSSGDQYISLWKAKELDDLPIQVDLELVDYANGNPTQWSQFSHSSAWADMEMGIKGAAHKLLYRSITAKSQREAIVLKGKKRTPKKMVITDYAASLKGVRKRIQPVLDGNGNQLIQNGLPVFEELPSKDAEYYNDYETVFSILFDSKKKASPDDIKNMMSFKGLLVLMRKYLSRSEVKIIVDRFIEILFGKGAQGWYRGREGRLKDFQEKTTALRVLSQELGLKWERYLPTIRSYYKSYK